MYRSLLLVLCLAAPCAAETFLADFENVQEDPPAFYELEVPYGPFQWSNLFVSRNSGRPQFDTPDGDYYARFGTINEDGNIGEFGYLRVPDGYAELNGAWLWLNPLSVTIATINDQEYYFETTEPKHWEYVDFGGLELKSLTFNDCSYFDLAGQHPSACRGMEWARLESRVDGLDISYFNQEGDANDDGAVDLQDLNGVRNEFGVSGPPVYDANDDGVSDLGDLNSVRNFFGEDVTQGSPQSVPEPSTLALIAVASVVLLARRMA